MCSFKNPTLPLQSFIKYEIFLISYHFEKPNTMRYFLGLDLSPASKLAVEQWRNQALPPLDKSVPMVNFHITLSFLGQVSDKALDMLCSRMDKTEFAKVSLKLERMAYWPKPKVLFLAPSHTPQSLVTLAKATERIANSCKIVMRQDDYKPHVTIARGLKSNPPCELFPPNVSCEFDKVHLFESVSGKHGVRYPIRKSWQLKPNFCF
jgi:2'-5' RNA ligase